MADAWISIAGEKISTNLLQYSGINSLLLEMCCLQFQEVCYQLHVRDELAALCADH